MPWTLAHPAAVLPLCRLPWLARQPHALVLGAMAPDAARHVGLPGLGPWMHDWHAVLTWHWWVVALLAMLLSRAAPWLVNWWPSPLKAWGLRSLGHPGVRHRATWGADFAAASAGALLGLATHLAWDSFTHDWGWPARHWPVLRALIPGFGVPVFSGLQLLSSALGVLLIVRALSVALAGPLADLRASRHAEPAAQAGRWWMPACAWLAAGLLLAWPIWQWLPEVGHGGEIDWAGQVLVSLVDGFTLSYLMVCGASQLVAGRSARRTARHPLP